MNHLSRIEIFNQSQEYTPLANASAVDVDVDQYAIATSDNDIPLIITRNVSNCVGVAMVSKGEPNIGAILHIFSHSDLFSKTEEELEQHVQKAWRLFVNKLNDVDGNKREFEGYVLGGWPVEIPPKKAEIIPTKINSMLDTYIQELSEQVCKYYPNDLALKEWPSNKTLSTLPRFIDFDDIAEVIKIRQKTATMDEEASIIAKKINDAYRAEDLDSAQQHHISLSKVGARQELEIMNMWAKTAFQCPKIYSEYQTHDVSTSLSNELSVLISAEGRFNLHDLGFMQVGHDAVVDMQQSRIAVGCSHKHGLYDRIKSHCTQTVEGLDLNL